MPQQLSVAMALIAIISWSQYPDTTSYIETKCCFARTPLSDLLSHKNQITFLSHD